MPARHTCASAPRSSVRGPRSSNVHNKPCSVPPGAHADEDKAEATAMSGAMRRIGEYLGLLEDTGYDELDGDGYDAQDAAPARETRPDRAPRARSASVADINERRRTAPAAPAPAVGVVAELSRITTLHPSTYNEARAV